MEQPLLFDPLRTIRAEGTAAVERSTPEGITFPSVIDSTMRGDFVGCKHRFYEAHILHLRGSDTNVHLHFGACFARGLEVFRRSFYSPSSPSHRNMGLSFVAGMRAIIFAWGDYTIPSATSRPASYKTLEACLDAYYSFFERYPPESDEIQPLMVNDEPAIEFSFALPIPHTRHPETGFPVLYAGRFDMLARYGRNSIYIDDEKTTTSLGSTWLNRWKLAGQFTGYIWAANEYGYKASGAIIRGISILSADIGHARPIEQRHAFQISRWLDQLSRDVEAMIQCWNHNHWDYAFDKACSEFGGCAYMQICSSEDQDTWRRNFKRLPWDPLRTRE